MDEVKEQIARDMAASLALLQTEQNAAIQARMAEVEAKRREMARAQHQTRRQAETLARQKRSCLFD